MGLGGCSDAVVAPYVFLFDLAFSFIGGFISCVGKAHQVCWEGSRPWCCWSWGGACFVCFLLCFFCGQDDRLNRRRLLDRLSVFLGAAALPPGGAGAAVEAHGGEPDVHAVRPQELQHQRGEACVFRSVGWEPFFVVSSSANLYVNSLCIRLR